MSKWKEVEICSPVQSGRIFVGVVVALLLCACWSVAAEPSDPGDSSTEPSQEIVESNPAQESAGQSEATKTPDEPDEQAAEDKEPEGTCPDEAEAEPKKDKADPLEKLRAVMEQKGKAKNAEESLERSDEALQMLAELTFKLDKQDLKRLADIDLGSFERDRVTQSRLDVLSRFRELRLLIAEDVAENAEKQQRILQIARDLVLYERAWEGDSGSLVVVLKEAVAAVGDPESNVHRRLETYVNILNVRMKLAIDPAKLASAGAAIRVVLRNEGKERVRFYLSRSTGLGRPPADKELRELTLAAGQELPVKYNRVICFFTNERWQDVVLPVEGVVIFRQRPANSLWYAEFVPAKPQEKASDDGPTARIWRNRWGRTAVGHFAGIHGDVVVVTRPDGTLARVAYGDLCLDDQLCVIQEAIRQPGSTYRESSKRMGNVAASLWFGPAALLALLADPATEIDKLQAEYEKKLPLPLGAKESAWITIRNNIPEQEGKIAAEEAKPVAERDNKMLALLVLDLVEAAYKLAEHAATAANSEACSGQQRLDAVATFQKLGHMVDENVTRLRRFLPRIGLDERRKREADIQRTKDDLAELAELADQARRMGQSELAFAKIPATPADEGGFVALNVQNAFERIESEFLAHSNMIDDLDSRLKRIEGSIRYTPTTTTSRGSGIGCRLFGR